MPWARQLWVCCHLSLSWKFHLGFEWLLQHFESDTEPYTPQEKERGAREWLWIRHLYRQCIKLAKKFVQVFLLRCYGNELSGQPNTINRTITMLFLFETKLGPGTLHCRAYCCVSHSVMSWLFCDPINCSPPGSSVHGVSQARVLEWAAISSTRGSSPPRDPSNPGLHICISGRLFTTEPLEQSTAAVASGQISPWARECKETIRN